jgi:hypothetical protein
MREAIEDRIHRVVLKTYPGADLRKAVSIPAGNVQILIVQDGQRHSFSLGPATAMTEMDDEAYFGVRTLGLAPF